MLDLTVAATTVFFFAAGLAATAFVAGAGDLLDLDVDFLDALIGVDGVWLTPYAKLTLAAGRPTHQPSLAHLLRIVRLSPERYVAQSIATHLANRFAPVCGSGLLPERSISSPAR